MKNYKSIKENFWFERNPNYRPDKDTPVDITEMWLEISEEKKAQLIDLYNSIKPEVPEGSNYQIIAMSATEHMPGVFKGILNCRIDTTHKQIRF